MYLHNDFFFCVGFRAWFICVCVMAFCWQIHSATVCLGLNDLRVLTTERYKVLQALERAIILREVRHILSSSRYIESVMVGVVMLKLFSVHERARTVGPSVDLLGRPWGQRQHNKLTDYVTRMACVVATVNISWLLLISRSNNSTVLTVQTVFHVFHA